MKFAPLIVIILLLLSGSTYAAEATVYELKSRDLDRSENVTIEAWVKPGAGAAQGARIIDKWGLGSQLGYRLQMGDGGKSSSSRRCRRRCARLPRCRQIG